MHERDGPDGVRKANVTPGRRAEIAQKRDIAGPPFFKGYQTAIAVDFNFRILRVKTLTVTTWSLD
jgi:hypothetical protein